MISDKLQLALQDKANGVKLQDICKAADTISLRYREQSGKGRRLLTKDSEALAYSLARMPATYGAVQEVVEQVLSTDNNIINTVDKIKDNFYQINSLLDIGAGTGVVGWVMDKYFDLSSIICLEREAAMIRMGENLTSMGSPCLKAAKWIKHDIEKENINYKADLVTASYVLNELTEEVREEVVEQMWKATNRILIIIEPGTPVGFMNIKSIRQRLISKGAKVLAPCTHSYNCAKTEEDWCHFSCRISRTSMHRELKGGDLPYEDEKFSYLVVAKEKGESSNKANKDENGSCENHCGRILRHPQVRKGHIIMELCTAKGIENITISKRDRDNYKNAKKLKQGDKIFL